MELRDFITFMFLEFSLMAREESESSKIEKVQRESNPVQKKDTEQSNLALLFCVAEAARKLRMFLMR